MVLMGFTEVVPGTALSDGLWKHRPSCIWGGIWEKYGLSVPEQRCKDRERSAVSVRLNRRTGLNNDLLALLEGWPCRSCS